MSTILYKRVKLGGITWGGASCPPLPTPMRLMRGVCGISHWLCIGTFLGRGRSDSRNGPSGDENGESWEEAYQAALYPAEEQEVCDQSLW